MDCNVDINAGIENCGGMKEFYIEILDSVVEEGKKEDLIKDYAEKNLEMYAIDVHALKGTMRLIGAIDAGDIAEKLQFAAQNSDMATIDSLHNEFLEMMDASMAKIREQL